MSVYLPATLDTLRARIAFATVGTWTPVTQEECREAILSNDLTEIICCSRTNGSGCLTFAQAYTAVFLETLEGKKVRRPTETERQAKGLAR